MNLPHLAQRLFNVPLAIAPEKAQIIVSGTAAYGQRIDNLDMRYQPLGYLTDGKL